MTQTLERRLRGCVADTQAAMTWGSLALRADSAARRNEQLAIAAGFMASAEHQAREAKRMLDELRTGYRLRSDAPLRMPEHTLVGPVRSVDDCGDMESFERCECGAYDHGAESCPEGV